MSNIQFYEEQRLRSPIVWVLTMLVPLFLCVVLAYQLATGKPVGDRPLSNVSLLILIPSVTAPTILLMRRLKFTIIIREDKVQYGFNFPTPGLNEIRISEISECYLTTHKAGNIGYHVSVKNGLMFNLNGKKSLQIVKHSGEKILVGTNKGEELRAIFEKK